MRKLMDATKQTAQSVRLEKLVTPGDVESIRRAITAWGKPREVADTFDCAVLLQKLKSWEEFVDCDWEDWDISEYLHDIGVRTWIQVAIEHCSSDVFRATLEEAVAPMDASFRSRMMPMELRRTQSGAPLSDGVYFWETGTIHPELAKG